VSYNSLSILCFGLVSVLPNDFFFHKFVGNTRCFSQSNRNLSVANRYKRLITTLDTPYFNHPSHPRTPKPFAKQNKIRENQALKISVNSRNPEASSGQVPEASSGQVPEVNSGQVPRRKTLRRDAFNRVGYFRHRII